MSGMNPLEIAPRELRNLLEKAAAAAAGYWESLPDRPVHPNTSAKRLEELFSAELPELGVGADAFNDLKNLFDNSRAGNGRFFGYVLGSGEPVAAIADLLASALNQNCTAWRSSPAAVTIEKIVISWLASAIGCGGFTGSLTGGGSSANLMGLAMAREAKAPANDDGVLKACTVYASAEVHMSIPKAVALLGMGHHAVRFVPIDDNFRMIAGELESAIEKDRAAGKTPVAVV